MAAADYGSAFGLLVFAQEVILLALFAVRAACNINAIDAGEERLHDELRDADDQSDAGAAGNGEPLDLAERLDPETRFLFDVIARENEGIVQNLDALDNGLIAVAVGIIAVTLFAADKWFDLDPTFRFAGFFFLVESAAVALSGYLTNYFVGPDTVDVDRFHDFTVDFSDSAADATLSAVADITRSAEANVVVRRYKRAFIMLATLLVIMATGIVVAGRALGNPSSH